MVSPHEAHGTTPGVDARDEGPLQDGQASTVVVLAIQYEQVFADRDGHLLEPDGRLRVRRA